MSTDFASLRVADLQAQLVKNGVVLHEREL